MSLVPTSASPLRRSNLDLARCWVSIFCGAFLRASPDASLNDLDFQRHTMLQALSNMDIDEVIAATMRTFSQKYAHPR